MPLSHTYNQLRRYFTPRRKNSHEIQISRRALLKGAIAIAALASVTTVNPWVARAALNLAVKSYGGTIDQVGSTCTGSMSAGSPTLTVNAVPANMQINDYIIVEIGGEAGAGALGTRGVGGQWPTLLYADVATMLADSSQLNGTYAGVLATGDQYVWSSAGSDWNQVQDDDWYNKKLIPKSLRARITNISGTTVTLDTNATIATTNANVYCDNESYLDSIGANPGSSETVWIIPAGTFALGDTWNIADAHPGVEIYGQGKTVSELFSPRGVGCIEIHSSEQTGPTIHDFAMRGNFRNSGFGKHASGSLYAAGLHLEGGGTVPIRNAIVYNIKSSHLAQKAVWFGYSIDCLCYDCEYYSTDGLQVYVQWYYGESDAMGGNGATFTRCTVDSDKLIRGFETFRSSGTRFIDCVSRNAAFSCNSSGNWLLDNFVCTWDCTQQISQVSVDRVMPIIQANSNIQPPNASMLQGGEIRNPSIIISGTLPFGSIFNPINIAIAINVDNPNISITGDYPSCSAGNNGYVEFPNTDFGPSMIVSTAEGTLVEGIRTIGLIGDSFHRSINLSGTNGLVQNCVTDQTPKSTGSGGSVTNWITNAQWAARCPHVPRQD